MHLRFVILAILAGVILSPAARILLPQPIAPSAQSAVASDVDPIGPPAYDGVLMLRELTLEESTAQAGLIVVGRVSSQTSRAAPGTIVTDVTVAVEKQLKGTPVGPNLTFVVQGGSVGGQSIFAGGQPNFVNGERVLLFLRSATDRQLVQMYTSRYTLAAAQAVQPENSKSLTISDVETRMTAVLNAQGVSGPVSIGATTNPVTPSAPFTTYCIPWTTNQMPVQYRLNDGKPPTEATVPGSTTNAGTDASTDVQAFIVAYQALSMWQVLNNSATAFTLAGPSLKDGLKHDDNENTIAWANINVVDGGGPNVIGLNFCQTSGGLRRDSDTLLTNNSAWTWDSTPDNGIDSGHISVKAVLAHELGHGLGLDHADAGSTPVPCPAPSGQQDTSPTMCSTIWIGWDKFIQADDQAGAANRYPITGAAPGAPSGLGVTATSTTVNTLSWTHGTGSRFAYEVERATGSCTAPFRSINSVDRTATSFVDNNYGFNLTPGTTYCYRVKALGSGGDSGYSNSASNAAPPAAPCSNAGLISNPAGPNVNVNQQVTFTASATCGGTANYMWWVGKVISGQLVWTQMTNYGPSNVFNWTPTSTGTYNVGFWVQNAGGSASTFEASFVNGYNVLPPAAPCTNAGLISNPAGPNVNVNQQVTFTASATCGGTANYMWWVGKVISGQLVWTQMTNYGPSNVFNWTPTSTGTYNVGFWVQNAGGSASTFEASFVNGYNVLPPAAPCSNAGLISNPAGPNVNVNQQVTFTASATCGGTANYMWWVGKVISGQLVWTQMTNYGPSNVFNWTPTSTGTYNVGFWVQNAGGSASTFEASMVNGYNVLPPATPCSNAGLISNPAGPNVNVNQQVTFTASATCGGTANYMWWVGKVISGQLVWTQMTNYGPSNVFNWTPTSTGTYSVGFWVQNAGGSPSTLEASMERGYNVVP